MDLVSIIISVCVCIEIFLILVVIIASTFFHLKFTDVIVQLLKEYGFFQLSNKLQQLVGMVGKIPIKGTYSKETKLLFKAWNDFRCLKISKEKRKLYKLQLFYKIVNLIAVSACIFFIMPVLILIIFLLF
jgi:hypothetical protein